MVYKHINKKRVNKKHVSKKRVNKKHVSKKRVIKKKKSLTRFIKRKFKKRSSLRKNIQLGGGYIDIYNNSKWKTENNEYLINIKDFESIENINIEQISTDLTDVQTFNISQSDIDKVIKLELQWAGFNDNQRRDVVELLMVPDSNKKNNTELVKFAKAIATHLSSDIVYNVDITHNNNTQSIKMKVIGTKGNTWEDINSNPAREEGEGGMMQIFTKNYQNNGKLGIMTRNVYVLSGKFNTQHIVITIICVTNKSVNGNINNESNKATLTINQDKYTLVPEII